MMRIGKTTDTARAAGCSGKTRGAGEWSPAHLCRDDRVDDSELAEALADPDWLAKSEFVQGEQDLLRRSPSCHGQRTSTAAPDVRPETNPPYEQPWRLRHRDYDGGRGRRPAVLARDRQCDRFCP